VGGEPGLERPPPARPLDPERRPPWSSCASAKQRCKRPITTWSRRRRRDDLVDDGRSPKNFDGAAYPADSPDPTHGIRLRLSFYRDAQAYRLWHPNKPLLRNDELRASRFQ